MTNEEYAVLTNELRTDPLNLGYSGMSDQQVAEVMNDKRYNVPTQRFVSMRAIAAVLDDIVFHYQR